MEELILPFISGDSNSLFIDSEQRQESFLVSKVLTKINQRRGTEGLICFKRAGERNKAKCVL